MIKFLKCLNPNASHIKMVYGLMLQEWKHYKCECGYDYEGFTALEYDILSDDLPAFDDVDPEAETGEHPAIK